MKHVLKTEDLRRYSMIKTFKAWAIDTNEHKNPSPLSHPHSGFIGRYWNFEPENHPSLHLPVHLMGCVTALFKNRQLAREGLRHVKRSFPYATVRKVVVTIETVTSKGRLL